MDADILIEPEPEEILAEPEPEPEVLAEEPEADTTPAPTQALALPVMEILPADFPLPLLTRFVPDPKLREHANAAAAYALAVEVRGPEGLQRADVALTAVRACVKAIEQAFEEPTRVAYELHKRMTNARGDWCADGKAAIATVGHRIYAESRRLEEEAREVRRRAQEEEDRKAREAIRKEAEAAAKAQAPEPVVQELQRQAETATAPPVHVLEAEPPKLSGNSTVEKWKGRFKGTPADAEPNPEMKALTPAQRDRVLGLMRAVLEQRAPLVVFELNWAEINRRANGERLTFAIPELEAFDCGGIRAKSSRAKR